MVNDWYSRYKFIQRLGQGGMGTVYLAEDRLEDNKTCVIKQLINKFSDETEHAEAVRLFQREVKILRGLNHPGVVRIFDNYVSPEGRYFLVMDYIPGKNLETIIGEMNCLSSEIVVRIAIQCCDVLEYLHSNTPPIIYRDLKPSNLMLTPDGRIIFIDFGIARAFMPKDIATRVVTAGYSPPEQYFGRPETRSDLYSLGATLSHLVTGSRPKPLITCNPILLNANVQPSLDILIKNLTAHDVEDRPSSAEVVRYELYKIYNEFHPEFAIPTVAPKNYLEEKGKLGKASQAKKSRKLVSLRIPHGSTSEGTNSAHKVPAQIIHRLARQDLNLLQKVKQWLALWL